MTVILRILAATALVAASSLASTVSYSFAGTFDGGANDTELITPSKSFSGTFTVTEPVFSSPFTSNQANTDVTMTYILDGAVMTAYSPRLTLWTFGGFALIFYESDLINRVRLNYGGPVMFTGPTSAPVLSLPWALGNGGGSWSYASPSGTLIDNGTLTGVSATSAPEPASFALLGSGLGIYFAFCRSKRAQKHRR